MNYRAQPQPSRRIPRKAKKIMKQQARNELGSEIMKKIILNVVRHTGHKYMIRSLKFRRFVTDKEKILIVRKCQDWLHSERIFIY